RAFKERIHHDWGGGEAEDIAAAGRWLARQDWVDEDRLLVYGGSYGGYSTYWQLVRYPGLWSAGIAWVGITDLHKLYEDSMPHFQAVLEEQLGDPEEDADLYRERSPITHVEGIEDPILMVHGENDPRCPLNQAQRFRDALVERRGWREGEEFEYVVLTEEGHGTTDLDQKVRAFEIIDEYLERWR
ncbi:MAG: alpha/beta hydrolase family protein, partial [Halobacteriota archaeon]